MEKDNEKIESEEVKNAKLRLAINTTLEVENAFKVYAYRLATPDALVHRLRDLSDYYLSELEKIEQNGQ